MVRGRALESALLFPSYQILTRVGVVQRVVCGVLESDPADRSQRKGGKGPG